MVLMKFNVISNSVLKMKFEIVSNTYQFAIIGWLVICITIRDEQYIAKAFKAKEGELVIG